MDLRCPFGCREHHRRQRSSRRSTAYYQTAAGKQKKKRLNGKRQRRAGCGSVEQQQLQQQAASANGPAAEALPLNAQLRHTSAPQPGPPTTAAEALSAKVELRLEGVVLRKPDLLNSPMPPYVRMLVWLVEGLQLGCDELIRALGQAMRQHSIAYRSRTDYVLVFLHQHPP